MCWCACATSSGGRPRRSSRGSDGPTTRALTWSTCCRPARSSSSYPCAALMGQHFLQHLRAFLGEDLDAVGFWQRLVQLSSRDPQPLGIGRAGARPRGVRRGGARRSPRRWSATPSYIADLLAVTDLDALATPVPTQPVPLLQALLRHALLREYTEAAARAARRRRRRRRSCATPSWSISCRPRRRRRPGRGCARSRCRRTIVRDRLADARTPSSAEFRAALQALAGARRRRRSSDTRRHARRNVAPARRVGDLAGHADGSPRCAPRTPDRHQRRRLRLGREPAPGAARPAVTAVPDEPGPLVAAADDPGFIHAPSLNQASAAALLRNAHLAHGGERELPVRHRADLGTRAAGASSSSKAFGRASRSARCSATPSSATCTRRGSTT